MNRKFSFYVYNKKGLFNITLVWPDEPIQSLISVCEKFNLMFPGRDQSMLPRYYR